MTLDEAISEFKKRAEDSKKNSELGMKSYITKEKEEEQIAEWLEELKDYRNKNKMVVRVDVENIDSIKDKINELSKYAENQYSNGIDDYKNKIKEELDRFGVQNLDTCVIYDLIDREAERLKVSDDAKNNGWIPSSELFPCESGYYLVTYHEWSNGDYLPKFDDTYVRRLYYQRSEHFTGWNYPRCTDERAETDTNREVIAWMHLPSPYQPK